MGNLVGLEGIKRKQIEAVFFRSADELSSIIEEGKGATAAGDNGAINIWKDDTGFIRCEMQRYLRRMDSKIYRTISGAKRWATKWLKQIHSSDADVW